MGEIVIGNSDTHATPNAGYTAFYPKADKTWYYKDDTGAEYPITSQQQGQVVVVAKSGGDYSTIQGAIDSITDNSISKRYTVLIYPGIYTEDIVMEDYVSLRGIGGPSEVIINGTNSNPMLAFDSSSSESGVYDITFNLAPTTGTSTTLMTCDSGLHAVINCFFKITSSAEGVTAKFISQTGGSLLIVSTLAQYTMTGTSGTTNTHTLFQCTSTGALTTSVLNATVQISDANDDIVVFQTDSVPSTHCSITNSTLHVYAMSGSYSGTMYGIKGNASLEHVHVRSNHFLLKSLGAGTAYFIYVDTTGGTANMDSSSNDCHIEGFTNNYFAYAASGDTVSSSFDAVIAPDGDAGAGTIYHVNSYENGLLYVSDAINMDEKAAPGTPPSGQTYIYSKTDGKVYSKDDAGTEYDLTAGAGTKEVFFAGADYNGAHGEFRIRSLTASASFNFTFNVPYDFASTISLVAVCIPESGAAGSSKDIDLYSEYGGLGEAHNQHAESDTAATYDLTGTSDEIYELDLTPVFSSLAAGDYCGLEIDQNSIGGTINYIGIRLKYNVAT